MMGLYTDITLRIVNQLEKKMELNTEARLT